MSGLGESVSLSIVMIGDARKLQPISDMLQGYPNVAVAARAESAEYAYGIIRRCLGDGVRVNTVFLDPLADRFDPYKSSLFIAETRVEHPGIVFVLLASEGDLQSRKQEFLPEIRERIRHYYSVDPSTSSPQLDVQVDDAVVQCLAWQVGAAEHAGHRRYEYDVAMSFAGEDRAFALELRTILIGHGIRVFYDDDLRAQLWGKNLYTTLYDVYANKSRFCLLLVSKAYKDKMWTNHERVAAQARALEMREQEYILPVRLDDVSISGLPPTVAYLPAHLGATEIAHLLVRKLASVS
jgi:hypothetical protein